VTRTAPPVRLGLLAAARIAAKAVVAPLRDAEAVPGIDLVALAARDPGRAAEAADRWGIRRVHGSYEELLGDPDVDAVYIATPAAQHRPWAVAALEAGKHVLVEKPIANNADDAQLLADAAAAHPDLVVMEAFHWRYHPAAARITELVASGVLGRVERVEAAFDIPDGGIPRGDIRWDVALGGGATMDLGCYPIQWVRHAVAATGDTAVPSVTVASAVEPEPGIDGSLVAELTWPSGVTGRIGSSMIAASGEVTAYLVVQGALGTLTVVNPLAPQTRPAELRIDTLASGGAVTVEPLAATATYWHQLVAFRDAIVHGLAFPTTAADGVRNMRVIDACYRAASLEPRPTLV